jgi:preprotein translocase subunit SecF
MYKRFIDFMNKYDLWFILIAVIVLLIFSVGYRSLFDKCKAKGGTLIDYRCIKAEVIL